MRGGAEAATLIAATSTEGVWLVARSEAELVLLLLLPSVSLSVHLLSARLLL